MCNSWTDARRKFDWKVNLQRFDNAASHPAYFNCSVEASEVVAFEDKFRSIIDHNGSFEIAGAVCFWKNAGFVVGGNNLTQRLLGHLSKRMHWDNFTNAIKVISLNPSLSNFLRLREACSQPHGFATPITFLSFYNPSKFPMVDRHIANWWKSRKSVYGYADSPDFYQAPEAPDGTIQAMANDHLHYTQSWNAYMAWKVFCCDYADKLQKNCVLHWRARDVEIAVWMAQRNGLDLPAI